MNRKHAPSRRRFLASSLAGTAAALAAPAVITLAKTDSVIVMGEGDYRFQAIHDWPQLPDKYSWQTTHNVAVDQADNLYVIHEGRAELKDHPSIFVFDSTGRFVRAFGNQFQGGGHGLEVREEGGEEFLYVCAYQQVKSFAKLTLQGETVWEKRAPMESGVYAPGEDTMPRKIWGRDRFMPTNFAFLDDAGFLLADGYGSYYIHRYDQDANWISCFGGPGDGEGKFNLPHGIWIDRRPGVDERVVICDRAHHTLQLLTLEGKYLETLSGFDDEIACLFDNQRIGRFRTRKELSERGSKSLVILLHNLGKSRHGLKRVNSAALIDELVEEHLCDHVQRLEDAVTFESARFEGRNLHLAIV